MFDPFGPRMVVVEFFVELLLVPLNQCELFDVELLGLGVDGLGIGVGIGRGIELFELIVVLLFVKVQLEAVQLLVELFTEILELLLVVELLAPLLVLVVLVVLFTVGVLV